MPTETTPGPFRYSQMLPMALEHPKTYAVNSPGPGMNMPYSGPPRAIDLLPGPNKVLPNGMRNPWAPYAGETYSPAAFGAANALQGGVPISYNGGGGLEGGRMFCSASVPIGRGPSVIAPSGRYTAFSSSASAIVPRSVNSSVVGYSHPGGLGGWRADDGWEGSLGRQHGGIQSDMTSTAGAIPRLSNPNSGLLAPSSVGSATSGWIHALSSPVNHARLSPHSPEVYLQPPTTHTRPRRNSSVGGGHHHHSVPIDGGRDQYHESHDRSRSLSRSLSGSEGQHHYRRISNSPNVGSPLNPADDLGRRASTRRRHSSSSARHCSDCSA